MVMLDRHTEETCMILQRLPQPSLFPFLTLQRRKYQVEKTEDVTVFLRRHVKRMLRQ